MSNKTAQIDPAAGHTIPEAAAELERGPEWLRSARKSSRETFNETPLPRRGLHLWRYTDPGEFLVRPDTIKDSPAVEHDDDAVAIEKNHLAEGHLAGLVVDLGGRDVHFYGTEALAEQGVVVTTLSEAVTRHTELVERHLYTLVNNAMGKFEALNGALWNDGIFVYVPDGKTIEKPLHLIRQAGKNGSAFFPRLLVVVGRNSEMTLIDEYAGGSTSIDEGTSQTNAAVEIKAGHDSRVRYVSVQRQGTGSNSYLSHRAKIGPGATMLTVPLAFGGNISKANFGVTLAGAGADSRMYGMLFGSGRQHFDNHTMHEHTVGTTTSDIDFKVVLRDRAVSAYTGLIKIDQDAKTCEAYQENRNLLLNRGPKAETIPELEILNEDVKCSHGATIGPIDPESVFYLTSRGIDRDRAIRMIVSGFVEATLKTIPEDLRERITNFVTARLEGI